jgi:RNA polymerase sigma-70 factor, ECF subfamily
MVVTPRELIIEHPPDERELALIVDRARQGSAEAFEQLARRVRGHVRAWAMRITGDPDDAEDVAQLVLLRVRDRLGGFEGTSRFTTWLYRVTRNVALNRQRGELRRARLLEAHGETMLGAAPSEVLERVEVEERAGAARLALACLESLPSRQREIFELSDLAGLTSPEIAERLGIDAVTVRVHLMKARRAVRARMLAQHPRLLKELE